MVPRANFIAPASPPSAVGEFGVARLAPGPLRVYGMAVVSCGIYFGQFVSPLILKFAATLIGTDPFRSQFNTLAIGLGVATAIGLILAVKNKSKPNDCDNHG